MKRMSGNALEFCKSPFSIWLERLNAVDTAIASRKFVTDGRGDASHNPCLPTHCRPSSLRVDDLGLPGPESQPVAASWRYPEHLRVDLSLPFQDSEDDCFTPSPAPRPFSPKHGGRQKRIHPLQPRRKKAMRRHKAGRF